MNSSSFGLFSSSYTWSQKSARDPQIWVKIVGFEPNLTQICGIWELFWHHLYEALARDQICASYTNIWQIRQTFGKYVNYLPNISKICHIFQRFGKYVKHLANMSNIWQICQKFGKYVKHFFSAKFIGCRLQVSLECNHHIRKLKYQE